MGILSRIFLWIVIFISLWIISKHLIFFIDSFQCSSGTSLGILLGLLSKIPLRISIVLSFSIVPGPPSGISFEILPRILSKLCEFLPGLL